MAVNEVESMNLAFAQGTVDSTYITLAPNRKNVENPPIDRLSWPNYAQADKHIDPPHMEAHLRRGGLPTERKVANNTGDVRY